LWGVFQRVFHVSLDVFLLNLFFDQALGFWVERIGDQHSLLVIDALIVLFSGFLMNLDMFSKSNFGVLVKR
jgi:hypothetical protein